MVGIGRKQRILLGLRLAALVGIVAAIVILSLRYTPYLTDLFHRRQELREYVEAAGATGKLIFVCIQIFQVVIAAVPGEIVQIAGGYFFGVLEGAILLSIGLFIGTISSILVARWLGFGVIKALVPPRHLKRIYDLINGPKTDIAIFLLFLIPGLPKDIMTYAIGLTPYPIHRFLLIATAARLPALIASCYIGASFQRGSDTVAFSLLGLATALFLAGLLLRERIIAKIRQ